MNLPETATNSKLSHDPEINVTRTNGNILVVGSGTLSDVSVTGQWINVLKKGVDTSLLPTIPRNRLSSLLTVDLCNLAKDSKLTVDGNLYLHPDACLVFDMCSCSKFNLYCLDDGNW